MRKFLIFGLCVAIIALVGACEKHDPVLPGVRNAVFQSDEPVVLNENIENLPENITLNSENCPFTQDKNNSVWNGDKKIFNGFAVNNSVQSQQKPVCSGNFVYAGLTTGELVKINSKTREVIWIADVYSPSNMTGGASVLDIVAPLQISGNYIFASGLGNALCKINTYSGNKIWCLNISTAQAFILTDVALFAVAVDGNLYAIRTSDGAVFWKTKVKKITKPEYKDKTIYVGYEKFNPESGEKL